MKKIVISAATMATLAIGSGLAMAGEYHSGATLFCNDCHTMHASMQHEFGSANTVSATAKLGGEWLPNQGDPKAFLLKGGENEVCLSCHDGKTFAPDVLGANANASPSQGRSAGALNDAGTGAGYESYKGHTLGSTATPPGYNPAAVGAADFYAAADGLKCISCHAQHGPATGFRNLAPYALGYTWLGGRGVTAAGDYRPTYVISNTNDTAKDVWVNLASFTGGSGDAATFNPYYATANVSFNRNDATTGGTTRKNSNKMDAFCSTCHADFHGGPGDANIGGAPTDLEAFLRHPTSQVTIGLSATQNHSGVSSLSKYTGGTARVRTYASDRTGYTDASPGCISCHKAHGNQNPFGLIFLSKTEAAPTEEGSTAATVQLGQRNLCGNCHIQS